jgi:alkylhydroperoxidase family enzyme
VFRAYARLPEHFRAFMSYHDVLMRSPGGLSRVEREATAASRAARRRACSAKMLRRPIKSACIGARRQSTTGARDPLVRGTAIAAFFGFSNRMASLLDLRQNAEFFRWAASERPAFALAPAVPIRRK